MFSEKRLKIVKALCVAIFLLGAALVAFMVYTESEPGALPLALVLVGAIGYCWAWVRARR